MRINERFNSNPHRLLALHIHKSRIVTMRLHMRILPTLIALPRPLKELLPFIESEVLFTKMLQHGVGRSRRLNIVDRLSSLDRTLQIGGIDMGNLYSYGR